MVDGVRTFDPVGAFQRGRRGALDIQEQEQRIAQQPLRNELAGLQVQQAQQTLGQRETTFEQKQATQRATILGQSAQALKGLPLEQRDAAFASISPQLEQFGIDPTQFQPGSFTDINLDQAIAESQAFRADPTGQFRKGATFTVQTPEGPAVATNIISPTGQQRIEITPFGEGVVPISRLGETAAQQQLRQIQTEVGKAAGKAGVKLKTEPTIQAAVIQAVSEVKSTQKAIGDQRSNQTALNTYETAMKGLVDSLAGTDTGPFVGLLPALTANQQIADGATAAMSPILKDLFRTAGEGTFTDKDQELLTKMVPTRTDLPAARRSKIQNIDAIIRAKLAQPEAVQQAAPAQPAQQVAPTQAQAIPAPAPATQQQPQGRFLGFE